MEKECYVCSTTLNLHKHHVFGGANRKWSEKYKLYVYLCAYHHNMSNDGVHFNKDLMDSLHREFQQIFEKLYSKDQFVKIFGRNYLDGEVSA